MPLVIQYSPLDNLFVTSEIGVRFHPTKHKDIPHEGMDIRARTPLDLYNAHNGKVIFSGEAGGYGKVIVIQDQVSLESTLYAHLSEIDPKIVKDYEISTKEGSERGQVNYQTNQLPVQKLLVIL